MHKLWVRITISFLLLMSFLLLIAGFFLAELMKNTYYDLKKNQLIQTAQMTVNAIASEEISWKSKELQERVLELTPEIDTRITIIAQNGQVLADSEDDPSTMESHANRPEVQQVFEERLNIGVATRYSETLGYKMMYVAIPSDSNNSVVIRVSLSLEHIEKAIRKLWTGITIVLLLALLTTGLIGMKLAKGISGPIEEMIEVSEKIKEKDYKARILTTPKGELGQLAKAINVLASSLESQMVKLRENEQRLTGVLTNMMSGVLLVNSKGRILLANRAMGQMLGENPEKIIDKLHIEAVKNVELSEMIDHCLKIGNEIRKEIHFFYPEERILDAHLAPYFRETDEMKGIIAVLHDVTDVRRLEKMRSEFVANVSHELKTPITSLKGFAETLLDGAMHDPDLCQEFLTIIYNESERLHRLISDILHLSSIEQNRIPLHIERLNLTDIVLATAGTMKKEARKKSLQLVLPEKQAIWIEAEKDRIQQIVLNLVSNAIAYTPKGGKITISLAEAEESAKLIISDTGIGISEEDVKRIFERFYRVEKARSRSSGGTGLGLAIVKHLVESHQGRIDVDSVEGEGTTFTVTLPKKQNLS